MLSFHLARMEMLLLSRSRVLEPYLRHSFAESCYVRYPLEVLAVGIAVQLEIRLKNGELFLGKSSSDSLRFITALVTTLGVTAFCESTN